MKILYFIIFIFFFLEKLKIILQDVTSELPVEITYLSVQKITQ